MKQPIHRLAAVVTLLACTGLARLSAATITLDAGELLGTIFPGTPSNEGNATEQVSYLVEGYNVLGLATVDGTPLPANGGDPGSETYTLYNPSGAPAILAAPVISGANVAVNGPSPVIALGGFTYQYALFFQGNDAWVYFIGNIAGTDSIQFGTEANLGHYSLYNQSGGVVINPNASVPDGGTTILLVGLGLLVTAVSARRKKTA